MKANQQSSLLEAQEAHETPEQTLELVSCVFAKQWEQQWVEVEYDPKTERTCGDNVSMGDHREEINLEARGRTPALYTSWPQQWHGFQWNASMKWQLRQGEFNLAVQERT